jgi:hypothetical protein
MLWVVQIADLCDAYLESVEAGRRSRNSELVDQSRVLPRRRTSTPDAKNSPACHKMHVGLQGIQLQVANAKIRVRRICHNRFEGESLPRVACL